MEYVNGKPGISSPTTSLPEQQFIELRACIEDANHILRTLGNPAEPENPRQLQLKLASFKGKYVKADLSFRGKRKYIRGILLQAGRDYLRLLNDQGQQYLMYEKLISITSGQADPLIPHATIEGYCNEALNCELLYDFTRSVSGSVELLNRFYGIPLSIALLQQVGKTMLIQKSSSTGKRSGTLVDTTEQAIIISPTGRRTDVLEQISFNDIERISIVNH